MSFREYHLTREDHWRSIVLFGRNVATYKFALAAALIELSQRGDELVALQDLAGPYARVLCEHLAQCDTQSTSRSSRFLDDMRRFNRNELSWEQTLDSTVRLGFENVIDAFHVLPGGETGPRFFVDERKESGGIRLTEEVFNLSQSQQFQNFGDEVQARWRLVERSWDLRMPVRALRVEYDPLESSLYTLDSDRRIGLTGCRGALNGYQKGKCFYSFEDISIESNDANLAEIDHFFPHVLKTAGLGHRVDQVWNLVLASQACNRGEGGKFARVPSLRLLERLHRRNEYLISSHHPLRETLMAQTGKTEPKRQDFLQGVYDMARKTLVHTWEPAFEHEECF
jgi:hypothetical protein